LADGPFIARPAPDQPAEQQWQLRDTGPEFKGPQPWCRVCQKPVALWAWLKRKEGHADLYVHCHEDEAHYVIPDPLPGFCVVETFAYDDPHVDDGFWWVVRSNGAVVQESKAYIASNAGPALFRSKAGRFLRSKRGSLILAAVSLIVVLAQLIWATRW
jgi:hypothetical protein